MKGKLVSASALEIRYPVMASDLNRQGSLFGGRIYSIVDSEAGMVASKHSGTATVTRSSDRTEYPVSAYYQDQLIIRISINRAWRTSMELGAKVHILRGKKEIHLFSTYLTFIAIDSAGTPTAIPPIIPETDEEIRRYHQADVRRRSRLS